MILKFPAAFLVKCVSPLALPWEPLSPTGHIWGILFLYYFITNLLKLLASFPTVLWCSGRLVCDE